MSHNDSFKSTNVKKNRLSYLRYLYQSEDPLVIPFLCAYARGLREKLRAFINYCAKAFPNRKKLNEVLGELAQMKGLI